MGVCARRPLARRGLGVLALVSLSAPSLAQSPAPPPATAPANQPSPTKLPPPTKRGSLTPDVYFDAIGYTARRSWFMGIYISPHDPDTAYVPMWDGFLLKTTDGGKVWDEFRLVQETKPFYGDAGQRLYFGVHRKDAPAWGRKHTTGSPSNQVLAKGRSSLGRMRPPPLGLGRISPGAAGRAGAAGNVNFGIGIAGKSPRLQTLVRKFTFYRPSLLGLPLGTSGLNIKQMLYFRGNRPTEIRRVIFHPKDPKVVFVCTLFGLFRSYDGGLNWVRAFQGVNSRETSALSLAIDPTDPKNVLLGTGAGMYVSTDGGENFMKSTAQGMGVSAMDWIAFHPKDPRYVFACTYSGLLRSSDGGKTWRWIYFTTYPTARVVRHLAIDPFNPKRAFISTADGVFGTEDVLEGSLEDWRRVGGLRFTGSDTTEIVACPRHPGHLWAVSNMRLPLADIYRVGYVDTGGSFVWESVDGGKQWRVIFSGQTWGAVQWFAPDRRDPDLLWIATSREMVRMKRYRGVREESAARRRQAERVLVTYPPFPEVMMAAMRFTGVEANRVLGYRRRARLRALVPRLDASYIFYRYRDLGMLHDGLYHLPFRFNARRSYQLSEFRVMLNWDMSNLVFSLDASLFGRVNRLNGELYAIMVHSIQRYYGELRQLTARMVTTPPKDLRARLMYKLRIDELESLVDLFTGGYLTRYKRGDRVRGYDTPWFDKHKGIKSWFPGAYR